MNSRKVFLEVLGAGSRDQGASRLCPVRPIRHVVGGAGVSAVPPVRTLVPTPGLHSHDPISSGTRGTRSSQQPLTLRGKLWGMDILTHAGHGRGARLTDRGYRRPDDRALPSAGSPLPPGNTQPLRSRSSSPAGEEGPRTLHTALAGVA